MAARRGNRPTCILTRWTVSARVQPSSPSIHADTTCDRRYLYTSGSEGYMRVFDANVSAESPFEAKLIEYHDEPVTAIAASVSSHLP